MRNRYTDLLPTDRKRTIRREYFVRVGVVSVMLATVLVAVYGVLLIPTFLYLSSTAATKTARLADLKASLSSADEAQLSARLSALSKDASTLLALSKPPSVTAQVSAMLAIPRPGITLSNFAYTAAAEPAAATLVVSGMANTRDSLRQYQLALQAAPFAASADLPVSAYAKDANIPFAITVTLQSP